LDELSFKWGFFFYHYICCQWQVILEVLFRLLTFSMFFLVSFYDPGPHGNFRYSRNMLPEVRESDFRKGSQVTLPYYLVKLSLSVKYVPSVVQDAPYFQQNLIYSQSHSWTISWTYIFKDANFVSEFQVFNLYYQTIIMRPPCSFTPFCWYLFSSYGKIHFNKSLNISVVLSQASTCIDDNCRQSLLY
jgi:hypothetical protein